MTSTPVAEPAGRFPFSRLHSGDHHSVEGLQRVSFRFAGDLEVRYLPQVPEAGDLVSHETELWVVAFVSADTVGVTVICELPSDDGRHLQHVA
jgi:hypothetical protein